MTLNDMIKNEYMKIFYERLGLKEADKVLQEENVIPKQPDSNQELISKYFYLLNNINLSELSKEDLSILTNYFQGNNDLQTSAQNILLNNVPKILYPKTIEDYYNYDPINGAFLAPTDSICFLCQFIQYDKKDEFESYNKVVKQMNYLQESNYKDKKIKVTVFPCNEIAHIRIIR